MFANDKHPSLLRMSIEYNEQSFIKLAPEANVIKLFYSRNLWLFQKS